MRSTSDTPILEGRYPASDAGLRGVLEDFDRVSAAQGWAAPLSGAVRLALEELAINVIRHGGQPAETGWFAVLLHESGCTVSLTIDDAGIEFDPTSHPAPDSGSDLDAREPGGHGIALVRSLMDEFRYRRRGPVNRTTVVRSFPPRS